MTTPERVFRPRFMLAVCIGLAVAFVAGAVVLLVTLAGSPGAHSTDRVAIVLIALIAVVTSVLLGRVRAVADDDGLLVRNPIRARRIPWAAIVAVRLGTNDSWVQLALDDGTDWPVMAVQAADGRRARKDVAWLRDRVAAHEGREP